MPRLAPAAVEQERTSAEQMRLVLALCPHMSNNTTCLAVKRVGRRTITWVKRMVGVFL